METYKINLENLNTLDIIELQKIYNDIHEFRKLNPVTKYKAWETSRHHFLPRCYGGDNSPENYIRITNEEHFILHYILHKIHGGKMTSAFAYVCYGIFNNKNKASNVELLLELFNIQKDNIKKEILERMSGEKNPSYGKFGKEHPTSKVSKKGKDNPMFGKKQSEYSKMQTSKSNSKMVSARNKLTNETLRVTKEEFERNENLVGITGGVQQPNLTNTICCLDVKLGSFTRVQKEEYWGNRERYFAPASKVAKEFKKEKNADL